MATDLYGEPNESYQMPSCSSSNIVNSCFSNGALSWQSCTKKWKHKVDVIAEVSLEDVCYFEDYREQLLEKNASLN